MNKILDANQNGDITILKAELDLSDNCYDFNKAEMETYNIFDLINQLKQRDEAIDEAINYIKFLAFGTREITGMLNTSILGYKKFNETTSGKELLEILQKYKGDNNAANKNL